MESQNDDPSNLLQSNSSQDRESKIEDETNEKASFIKSTNDKNNNNKSQSRIANYESEHKSFNKLLSAANLTHSIYTQT